MSAPGEPRQEPLSDALRVVFFGTPLFAVPTLEALASTPDLCPILVVSQPSRPAGRGRRLADPAVVEAARRLELAVEQPARVRAADFMERLEGLAPDVAVVVAFGQIFRRRLLDLPRFGCVNLHGSLLPRWRGAAPIQWSIASGDATTGVTTMRMDRGLDTGPMLLRSELPIGPTDTSEDLAPRLAALGASMMIDTLRGLARGTLSPTPQDDASATLAPLLERSDGAVDWSWPAQRIYDRWRGFRPWPGLSARLADRPLKLKQLSLPAAEVASDEVSAGAAAPGTVLGTDGGALLVVCGDGRILRLERLQRSGKQAVDGVDLLNGERLELPLRFDLAAETDA
ncbi:MAG: methionyl-tRNA formyltransferase [Acidobacteriota bacterium]